MGSVTEYTTGTAAAMDSYKRELVIQLLQQRGLFWKAISAMRTRWNASPTTGLPDNPKKLRILALPPPGVGRRDTPEAQRVDAKWRGELSDIARAVVPQLLLGSGPSFLDYDWVRFLSVCVLFDPPDERLEEFAQLGPFLAVSPLPSGSASMAAGPVKVMHDPYEERGVAERAWSLIFEAVFELYLEPQGLARDDVLQKIHEARPEIRETRDQEWHDLRLRTYIEVNENTTWEDVKAAFKMIDDAREERPKTGRPKRDRLRCVQCAILHDQNGWTYEQIAQRYAWPDYTLASKYVADGRKILREG